MLNPLNESIHIILDQCFINSRLYQGLPRKDFEELLNLAVKNCHFLFNGNIYDQIDGVAMGSPLGQLLANIFTPHHENIWLDNCLSEFKPFFL